MSALSLSSIIKLIQKSKYGVTCGRLAAFSIAPVRFNVVACNGDVGDKSRINKVHRARVQYPL